MPPLVFLRRLVRFIRPITMLTQATEDCDALLHRRVASAQDVEGRDGREARVAAHPKVMHGGEILSRLGLLLLLLLLLLLGCAIRLSGCLVPRRLGIGRLAVAFGVEVDATMVLVGTEICI